MPSPSFQVKVILRPEIPGGFNPDTFDHLLQRQVELAGLDRRYSHTLIDAQVIEDGNAAELTIHSQPHHANDLKQAFRVLHGTPPAAVRVIGPDGEVLVEAQLPAPLQPGQRVQIGDREYSVHTVDWPHRNERGICTGGLDVQHALAHPLRKMPHVPWPKYEPADPARAQQRAPEQVSGRVKPARPRNTGGHGPQG